MKHISLVLFLALGLAVGAFAQSRILTLDGSAFAPTELHCSRNADATWDCTACGVVSASVDDGTGIVGGTERLCSSRPRTLKTANSNRVQTVADALGPAVLRQAGFGAVDAGSP